MADDTSWDDVVKIAYEAVATSLEHDSATTESLRGRATAVLSASTVMTAFVIGLDYHVGKADTPLNFPTWAVVSLTIVLAIISACCVRILWPIHEFAFGPSAEKIMKSMANGVAPIVGLKAITLECQASHQRNVDKLKGRYRLFQISETMLIAEIGILIAVLCTAK